MKGKVTRIVTATSAHYIIAIDLGTSGPKVGLVSDRGEVLDHEFEETPLIFLPNGGAEEDPAVWWEAIDQCVRRLLAKRLVPTDQVKAMVCTGQWSGIVAVDQDSNPLMNAITWRDMRGQTYTKKVTGGPVRIEGYGIGKLIKWIRRTGGIPSHSGKDSISHILFIQNEYPEIYDQTYKFLEPKDYLNLRLTGLIAASHDSMALCWITDNRDISNIGYDDDLIKMTGIDRAKLPELKRAIDILGPIKTDLAQEWGLSDDVQIVMGAPDVHSSTIGSGAVEDYVTHLYVGTSSWITCHVPFKKTDIFHNIGALPAAIPGKYMLTNEQESAGACLTFARDTFLSKEQREQEGGGSSGYGTLNRMAAEAPAGSNKVIFTPWLYGERAPISDRTIRGGFHNLSLQTTRECMVRAVFEGVAFNSKWLLNAVEKFIGREVEFIIIVGGGAVSDFWCQIYADILDREIQQIENPIVANIRGAAFLASVAFGRVTFDEVHGLVPMSKVYHPNPENRAIYRELFQEFVNLYRDGRRIYSRLNRSE